MDPNRIKVPLENYYPIANKCNELDSIKIIEPHHISFSNLEIEILYSCSEPTTVQTLKYWFAGTRCSYLRNNSSIVVKINLDGVSFLFTGDINGKLKTKSKVADVEKILIENVPKALQVNVIKIPHHGSATSSSKKFIEQIVQGKKDKSIYAIISAGEFPILPSFFTMKRLKKYKQLNILRTDRTWGKGNDNIVCTVHPESIVNCEYK